MTILTAEEVVSLIQKTISEWHMKNRHRSPDYVIVTEDIRRIRTLNEHRNDLGKVVKELVVTNTEMWHEEDKVRSENDEVVLKAIRNINPLNQHRNDLIEEIDEIVLDEVSK